MNRCLSTLLKHGDEMQRVFPESYVHIPTAVTLLGGHVGTRIGGEE